MAGLPILYSFRRCPYAMRARMALYVSGEQVELREVVLRDKPDALLAVSPKGTVPVLLLPDGAVLEESRDIMGWALEMNDPEGWLNEPATEMEALIDRCDSEFKFHLDRYKYANRYDGADSLEHRREGELFLADLEERLKGGPYLFGSAPCLADYAIAPFIRQFANTDITWFETAPYPHVRGWLGAILSSGVFAAVMQKYSKWQPGEATVLFPS